MDENADIIMQAMGATTEERLKKLSEVMGFKFKMKCKKCGEEMEPNFKTGVCAECE